MALFLPSGYAEEPPAAGKSPARPDATQLTSAFEHDILPLLTRFGCNAAACHGAAGGRGGFKLSLFGSRPQDDYQQIVDAESGRRVQWSQPEESLLLRKPTQTTDHEGGFLFDVESQPWQLLVDWLEAGAPYGPALSLERLWIEPASLTLPHPSATETETPSAAYRIWALHTDGQQQDVTELAQIISTDPDRLDTRQPGTVALSKPGTATLIARHGGRFATAEIRMPFAAPAADDPNDSPATTGSRLDATLVRQLDDLRLPRLARTDDATLARRLWLDLTGRLPKPADQTRWLEDQRPDRTARLADRLLASSDFNTYWSLQWSRWLRVPSPGNEPEVARAYRQWLEQSIRDQRGWSDVVSELVQATGDSHVYGPAGFYRATSDPQVQAERFSETVLGIRVGCANCHDHPLDVWTQDDYHGLAAMFAQVDAGRVVGRDELRTVIHPVTRQPAVPRLLGTTSDAPAADVDDLADWLAGPGQNAVASCFVNRVWAALLGRGFVQPLEDWRSTNPAQQPHALELLLDRYQRSGGRLRPLVREVVLSDTYAAAEPTTPLQQLAQSRMLVERPRPLGSQRLFDAIVDVTEIPGEFTAEPNATRAVELIQASTTNASLQLLGRCPDPTACAADQPTPQEPDLRAMLHWINGPLLNDRLSQPQGWLARTWHTTDAIEVRVSNIYRKVLCRAPTADELAFWLDELSRADTAQSNDVVSSDVVSDDEVNDDVANGKARGDAATDANAQPQWLTVQDLTWSLLSSPEFMTQH